MPLIENAPENAAAAMPRSLDDPLSPVSETWVDFVQKNDLPSADLSSEQSAAGTEISDETVARYLALLRAKFGEAIIEPVRRLTSEPVPFSGGQLDHPTFTPFLEASGCWSFAAAYIDCIHWFGGAGNDLGAPQLIDTLSRPVRMAPRLLQASESGLAMLLQMRCLLHGCPSPDQETFDAAKSNFRIRLLIECYCDELDPTDNDLWSARDRRAALNTSQFEESMYEIDLSAAVENRTAGDISDELMRNYNNPFVNADGGGRDHLQTPPLSQEDNIQDSVSSTDHVDTDSNASTPPQSSPSTQSQPPELQERSYAARTDRRDILGILNEATRFSRAYTVSSASSLALLWSLVSRSKITSVLHYRYCCVLYYHKIKTLEDDTSVRRAIRACLGAQRKISDKKMKNMRERQKEGQFWNELCNLRQDWGLRRFVLLCAVPARVKLRDDDAERQQMLRCISEQLAHHGSQLHTDLESAAGLCENLLLNSLPEERLMIENYSSNYFRDGMQIDDYQAFHSTSTFQAFKFLLLYVYTSDPPIAAQRNVAELATLKVYDKALEQLMDKFQSGAALAVADNVQCSGTFEHIFELAQLEEDSRQSLRKLQDEVNKLKAERKNLNGQVQEEGKKLRTVIEKVAQHQQYLDAACLDRVVPQEQYDRTEELFE
ncbi:hypothetical protein Purlil1_13924 [Purpureocillium lilacinum]|uniref:Uncharacterized protein n=1 Tax=Purpureocillium lilacinum TaxID=33203 RepID=A0ABR0BCQ1_PURLI|nr:hypothetical protein Purlil1_13924 [Purpureocillium lilacinum]